MRDGFQLQKMNITVLEDSKKNLFIWSVWTLDTVQEQ